MGMLCAKKSMVWWTICIMLPVLSAATLCRPGRQYWDEELERCIDCSNCSTTHGEVVLRPCQVHQDTHCGPLSALQIDWSFLRPKTSSKKREQAAAFTTSEKPEEKLTHHHYHKKQEGAKAHSHSKSKHHHQHHHHHRSKFLQMESLEESSHARNFSEEITTSSKHHSKRMRWDERNTSSSSHHNHHHHHNSFGPYHHNGSTRSRIHNSKEKGFLSGKTLPQSASQVKIAEEPMPMLPLSSGLVATTTLTPLLQSTPAPFSAAEEIVWDWQAIALALAVFACILFFLVAGAYSIHHARQWRRLRENFEADVEELSTRLSLMVPGSHADTNQCIYMEQLLVRKQQVEADEAEQGNVYIDRDKGYPQHASNKHKQ